MDENGDAAGNYTILSLKGVQNGNLTTEYGLHPIGTFSPPDGNQIPVSKLLSNICFFFKNKKLVQT